MYEPVDTQVRNWGMMCHLAALCALVGIPFGNILGPLGVWLIKGKEHPYLDYQGKEALNFQISMTIYFAIAGILIFLLIGIPLLIILALADIILTIVAALAASNGREYRYPITFRFIQ